MNVSPVILFRCDGSAQVGMGHVMRCLALAEEFKQRHCQIFFAMKRDLAGNLEVQNHGFSFLLPEDDGSPSRRQDLLHRAMQNIQPHVLVLDLPPNGPVATLEEVRRGGTLIVDIDDISSRRFFSDLVFYPPIPQVSKLDWSGFTGQKYWGWEWAILRREFRRDFQSPSIRSTPVVLVAAGSSDPAGITLQILRVLDSMEEVIPASVLVGQGFSHFTELEQIQEATHQPLGVYTNVQSVSTLMREASFAIGSFGVTAYELAAMGVPGIYLSLSEDHAESASVFVHAGIALSLGVYSHVSEDQLIQAVRLLWRDGALRSEMSKKAKGLVDGRGAQRVVERILSRLEERHEQYTSARKA